MSVSRGSLGILDDYFPNALSTFRFAEYNHYLEVFPHCTVSSTARDYRFSFQAYRRSHPLLAARVKPYSERALARHSLLYCVFLSHAYRLLSIAEKHKIPFAFTLYPGGGFGLNYRKSDNMLERVLGSQQLVKVIVTQRITVDYLQQKKLYDPVLVTYIYGGVMPGLHFTQAKLQRSAYGYNRSCLNVCFVAFKYMKRGLDKGFDVFVQAARFCRARNENTNFHVVGNFGPEDLTPQEKEIKIFFHGQLPTAKLRAFFSDMDMIVSANRPFVLPRNPGKFDGFPTGACVEASLSGVLMVCSDPLGTNRQYVTGEDFVAVSDDPEQVAETICRLSEEPELIRDIARKGQQRSFKLYSPEIQLGTRTNILRALLGVHGCVAL